MGQPNNPFDTVIKNTFFPDGLTEADIYNYWKKVKSEILHELGGSRSILYVAPGGPPKSKNIIIRRNLSRSDNKIQLTDANYDSVLHGRIVGILRVFDYSSNFGIVDIDSPEESSEISSLGNFNNVKELTNDAFNYLSKFFKCRILYTGKNGFHVRCKFDSNMIMSKVKNILTTIIQSSPLKTYFGRRNSKMPNIDLSPNMENGGFIIPYSINKIGLPCIEVKNTELNSFKREKLIKDVKPND